MHDDTLHVACATFELQAVNAYYEAVLAYKPFTKWSIAEDAVNEDCVWPVLDTLLYVAGREYPETLPSLPRLPKELPQKFPGRFHFPETSLSVDFKSNLEAPQKFPTVTCRDSLRSFLGDYFLYSCRRAA